MQQRVWLLATIAVVLTTADAAGDGAAHAITPASDHRWPGGRAAPRRALAAQVALNSASATSDASLQAAATSTSTASRTTAAPPAAAPAEPPRPSYVHRGSAPLLFTCPDGRRGLHVIHTRLMLNLRERRGATGTFRAGRMLLFRDFSLPSVARQTAQSFVLYVAYDYAQDVPFLEACHDILKLRVTRGASFLYLPERAFSYTIKAHTMLALPRVRELLERHGLAAPGELDDLDLYITSRIDTDDAANLDAVRLTQEAACAQVGPAIQDRMLLTYMEPKLYWIPDLQAPYGTLATIPSDTLSPEMVRKQRRAMRFRPIMQSMAVHASLTACTFPLNAYSHYHYQPSFIVFARNDTECPFVFDWHRNLQILRPGDGSVGGLYSRTPGSWYAELNDHGYKYLRFDPAALAACGVRGSEVAATNVALSALYKEAREAASLSSAAAAGFGGIGFAASWKGTKKRLYNTVPAYHSVLAALAERYRPGFRGAVKSRLYGARWVAGQGELDYAAVAAEVVANATARAEGEVEDAREGSGQVFTAPAPPPP